MKPVLATLATLIACALSLPSVVKFDMDRQFQEKVGLQSYSFNNCMPAAQEIAEVDSLVISPDPLVFPGPLGISFKVNVKDTLSNLKAVVILEKKVGSTWIKIPCIGNIGSCTYDDVCNLLEGIPVCPPPLKATGLTCKCPIESKTYILSSAKFQVDAAVFPPGDYRVQAKVMKDTTPVGCYKISVTFG